MELLRLYVEKDGVVAVGEIGYDDVTPAEEKYFAAQIELAKDAGLPILIHTPHRDKKRGTERTLDLVKESGISPALTLIDHNNEETIKSVLDAGCWAGHSIYPNTKMDEPRMVALVKQYGAEKVLINSAADWGVSDPLKVPKTAAAMKAAGISAEAVDIICWKNPVNFFAQSGRFDAKEFGVDLSVDQRQLFQGNSVLRGQAPRTDGK
ncbi:MAG TPA: TatD family hydrolase, partial [Polyangiaceae bacterium]|nr:TatD family hydrolase [Polyangiaceae bacterium]